MKALADLGFCFQHIIQQLPDSILSSVSSLNVHFVFLKLTSCLLFFCISHD